MPEDISSSSVGIREQIAKYSTELIRLRELLDLAFASGAKASKASEDGIVFPLLVSCRDILEEMLFAVNEGFGRAAVRSVRTMYECVVAARYLNLHPEKTSAFLSQFHVQWAKIIQSMPPEFRSPEMHGTISKHVPKYAQGKWVGMKDLNWSGKQTLEMAKEGGTLSDLHSMAFDYASAFIHPSAVFVLNAMSQQAGTEHVL